LKIFGADFETIAKEQIILIKIFQDIEGINSKVLEMTNERKKANFD
jgi:glutamine synthetase